MKVLPQKTVAFELFGKPVRRGFFFFCKSAEELIPDNEHIAEILVQVRFVTGMMYPVMRRRIEDKFDGSGKLVDVHAGAPAEPINEASRAIPPRPVPRAIPQASLTQTPPASISASSLPSQGAPARISSAPPPSTRPAPGISQSAQAPFAPSAPLSASAKPAYVVEHEDEQDMIVHREKVSTLSAGVSLEDIDGVIQGIIQRNAVAFADDVMEKRFQSIVRSRLSELRNNMETEEALERSQKIGGMGFESGLVRRLMVDVEEAAATIASKGELKSLQASLTTSKPKTDTKPYAPRIPLTPPHPSMVIPERQISGKEVSGVPYAVPPAPKAVSPASSIPTVRAHPIGFPSQPITITDDGSHEKDTDVSSRVTSVSPPTPSPLIPSAASRVWSVSARSPEGRPVPSAMRPELRAAKKSEVLVSKTSVIQPTQRPQRPTISDIIHAPVKKTLGPVDELAELTLQDFRRLGSGATSAKDKVMGKIELLEEESFALRSAGVKAWRRSPIFQHYLAIGRESIDTGASIQDIIARRASADVNAITYDEFEAVSDINRLLRY